MFSQKNIHLLRVRDTKTGIIFSLFVAEFYKREKGIYFFNQQILFHNNNGEREGSCIVKDIAETLKTNMH